MSEKQKQIMENFEKMLPKLTEAEQDRLVAFSEGMAVMKDMQMKAEEQKGE